MLQHLNNIENFIICDTCHFTLSNFTDEPNLYFDDHLLEGCESSDVQVYMITPLTVKLTTDENIDRHCHIFNAELENEGNNNEDDNTNEGQ